MLRHNAFKEDQGLDRDDLDKFYTKKGWLTEFALGCGYLERIDHHENWITLWKEGCYHVRWHDFKNEKRICWEGFDNLKEARKFFKKLAKKLETQ